MLALLLIVTYVAVPAGPSGSVGPARVEAAPVACPVESKDLDAARAAARGCQDEVPVAALTTEFDRGWARPDGSVRYEHRYRPVRVQRDGRWVPVDTALRTGADGAVRPVATATGLVFSGGGAGPMVEVSDGDAKLLLGSPVGNLPSPTLDGDTAVYGEVLPGVDLRLTADVDGYSQVLVVKNRRAAADPRLVALRFAVDADRLTLTADRAGNLRAKDAKGRIRLSGSTPLMWDADNVRVKAMATTVAQAALLVKPDRAMLADPRTEFPVFIDPGITAARTNYIKVDSGNPTTSYMNVTGNAPVGTNNGGANKYRSFFGLNVGATPIAGKHIVSAKFVITETHSAGCTPRQVDLWATGYAGAANTWNNQPTWSSIMSSKTVAAGYSTACPAESLSFDATPVVRSAADGSWENVTLALRSPNETDNSFYKTFNNNPVLIVDYLHYAPIAGCPGGVAIDSDFNGDGQSDMAVGAPEATVDGKVAAGTVMVHYAGGTSPQTLRQGAGGVPDTAEAGDRFGHSVATYDANQDGCADLVVGAPFETVGSVAEGGGVAVLFGGPDGFVATGAWYDQASTDIADAPETADWFGYAVTAGNTPSGEPFLAIGAPGEDTGTVADAGLVHYRLGSGNAAVAGTGTDDRAGFSLAGTPHHLAVGSPGRTSAGNPWAGAVATYLHQVSGTTVKAVGAPVVASEADANFGKSVDMVPVSGTTNSLLAVGAPGMTWSAVADTGMAMTYSVTPTAITSVASVHHPAATVGDYLGEQVRLSRGPDQTLVAAAPGDDVTPGRDAGLVLAWPAAGAGRPYPIRFGQAEQETEGAYTGASTGHLYLAQPAKGQVVAYTWTAVAAAAATTTAPPAAATWSGTGGFGTAVR